MERQIQILITIHPHKNTENGEIRILFERHKQLKEFKLKTIYKIFRFDKNRICYNSDILRQIEVRESEMLLCDSITFENEFFEHYVMTFEFSPESPADGELFAKEKDMRVSLSIFGKVGFQAIEMPFFGIEQFM